MDNEQLSRSGIPDFALSTVPESPQFDFIIRNRENIFTIQPVTPPAQKWAHEFLPRAPELWSDNKFPIAASDFVDVVGGIQRESLTVGEVWQ